MICLTQNGPDCSGPRSIRSGKFVYAACLSALRSLASHAATRSSTSHSRSVTPGAIVAGATRTVRWILMKLYAKYPSATAAIWFSIFFENAFVKRVKRLFVMRTLRFCRSMYEVLTCLRSGAVSLAADALRGAVPLLAFKVAPYRHLKPVDIIVNPITRTSYTGVSRASTSRRQHESLTIFLRRGLGQLKNTPITGPCARSSRQRSSRIKKYGRLWITQASSSILKPVSASA